MKYTKIRFYHIFNNLSCHKHGIKNNFYIIFFFFYDKCVGIHHLEGEFIALFFKKMIVKVEFSKLNPGFKVHSRRDY